MGSASQSVPPSRTVLTTKMAAILSVALKMTLRDEGRDGEWGTAPYVVVEEAFKGERMSSSSFMTVSSVYSEDVEQVSLD